MKQLGTIVLLVFAMIAVGCSSGGAGTAVNPLEGIGPIEFATFEDAATSSLAASGLQMPANERYDYVNSINEKLLVLIPNWLKNDLKAHFNNGGDLSQPIFLENEFPGSSETAGLSGKHVTKATVQRVESSDGLVFRGIVANRFAQDDGTFSDGATIDNLPIEVFFTQNRQIARVAVGYKPQGEEQYRRDAFEYNFQTKSGVMIGDWGSVDEYTGQYRINISYEGIQFDGKNVTYWYFQDDDTDTEVLMEHSGGISVGSYPKDDQADVAYTELDDNGAVTATNQADTVKADALDGVNANLTQTSANQKLTEIMNAATLTGGLYDELRQLQNARFSW